MAREPLYAAHSTSQSERTLTLGLLFHSLVIGGWFSIRGELPPPVTSLRFRCALYCCGCAPARCRHATARTLAFALSPWSCACDSHSWSFPSRSRPLSLSLLRLSYGTYYTVYVVVRTSTALSLFRTCHGGTQVRSYSYLLARLGHALAAIA